MLLCMLAAVCVLSYASKDDRKGKQIEPVYALPMPDVLPPVPMPDSPLPAIRELRPPIRHTVNRQQQGIDDVIPEGEDFEDDDYDDPDKAILHESEDEEGGDATDDE